MSEGRNFEVVADIVPPAPVEEIPGQPTVGLESTFDKVWRSLEEEHVGMIGLYGLGGVGKTTLLTQINNHFLKTSHNFDVVIWVVVSKTPNLGRVQNEIWEKVGFCDDKWKSKSRHEKVKDIWRALSKKRFVMLLDDMWEHMDLLEVGIPPPDQQNKSKLIFTTRSQDLCWQMGAHKKIQVKSLAWKDSWDLFQKYVGKDALNSNPEIPELAEMVAKECCGLPLAIITIGRAMASKVTPQDWKHAIRVLQTRASNFPKIKKLPIEMKNLVQLKALRLCTSKVSSIPRGLISSLLMLQGIGMYNCGLYDQVAEGGVESYGNESLIEELESLKYLTDLSVTIASASVFKRFLSSRKLPSCTHAICLKMFKGSSSLNLSSLENMKHLAGLTMKDLDSLREIKFDWAGKGKETVGYSSLNPKVKCFHGLCEVVINRCQMLKNLTWLIFAPNLLSLTIGQCDEMEEVIGKGAEDGGNLSPFTKLMRLELNGLPQLKNVYRNPLPFLYLDRIEVVGCPKLKKLPLNSNSANQGRVVMVGKQEWWNELEWEDEATLTTFLPSFKAI
ncbi:probable disease resistance protein At4g14610 [Vitis riparia]|uniref:probable disease resistance protein At4g14610 n=1 Tax=Vitis riparia TaxID=96939 RepID=UPI00155A4CFB|nr:probable disease resistance protein At4g14610 [Vitis riparia]